MSFTFCSVCWVDHVTSYVHNIACIKYNYKLSVTIAIGKVLQLWPTSVSHCHTVTSLPPPPQQQQQQQQQHMMMLTTTTTLVFFVLFFCSFFFKKILIFLLDTYKFNDEASNNHCWKGTILRHAELFENVLQDH